MAIQRDVADICAQSVPTHNFMVLCALYLKALAVSYGLATGRLASLTIRYSKNDNEAKSGLSLHTI
ncbi:hypothetical protein ASPFODRAFT_52390 [Aspergillus luchuensis CBS 106.47]|uniref:Uncharacterized protein n=1 Tax=Aspergillus luchuensis (strain CBS 106.47) TaxID=1137211 RepID=A0A1M3T3I3_ASPLC|nr:hypothetical protein ASPFODRAFT_52390 [Aspergillus luchuensis CBS 106.47]